MTQPAAPPVVFDTNALFLPFTDGTDLDRELERLLGATTWIVPSSVVGELKHLARGDSNAARIAKTALKLVEKRAKVESTGLAGDDGLLEVARRLKATVVTNDRRIQEEAARSGLRVLVVRK